MGQTSTRNGACISGKGSILTDRILSSWVRYGSLLVATQLTNPWLSFIGSLGPLFYFENYFIEKYFKK